MELKKCEPSLKENHTIIKTFKDVEYDNLNELLLMLHQQPKQAINRFFLYKYAAVCCSNK